MPMIAKARSFRHSVFTEIKDRQKLRPSTMAILAGANTLLWERFGQHPVTVRALSPSAQDVLIAAARIQNENLFREGAPRRRLPSLEPNDTSIAISLNIGGNLILLGADLEEVGHPRRGWQTVVANWNTQSGQHDYFKIPHHGSPNGFYAPVARTMLSANPEATLTPFRHMRPTDADIARTKGFAGRLFLTSPVQVGRYRPSNPAVAREVRGMARRTWRFPSTFGQIRHRRILRQHSAWRCDCFGAAKQL